MSGELFLGLDAGGSRCRWMLVDAHGDNRFEGEGADFSGLQLLPPGGAERLLERLRTVAEGVREFGTPAALHAGVTGVDGHERHMQHLLAEAFHLAPQCVGVSSDIDIACRDLFAPGEGYLVYAGTGSIAAYLDAQCVLHRAGGRGPALDDGGGGFWIGRQALKRIWRAEDESPGAWRTSPMACAVFARLGGDDWKLSRRVLYEGSRGDVGALAVAVAEAADTDPQALAILREAGVELARLAGAMVRRFGVRPVALSGRAADLHPAIASALRAALPDNVKLERRTAEGHRAAARLAIELAS